MVEVSYGPKGLALMEAGRSASHALATLLAADEGRSLRQVAMVDATGEVAVHTGESCIAEAGHLSGDGWSVQANIMRSDVVIPAMADALGASTGDFADRLLAALVAAEATGGDLRGSQSASLLVVAEGTDEPRLDLRVDDHPDPVAELSRLLRVARAYDLMNEGDEALAAGDLAGASRAYSAAARVRRMRRSCSGKAWGSSSPVMLRRGCGRSARRWRGIRISANSFGVCRRRG